MKIYLLIALALIFTTSGQLLQKLATTRANMEQKRHFLLQLLAFRETWLAVFCLVAGVVIWLAVLYFMDVSKATPFLSLGFILVTLVSRYHLKETVPVARWIGVFFVTAGLWLVSIS